jgi:hypothetical protein
VLHDVEYGSEVEQVDRRNKVMATGNHLRDSGENMDNATRAAMLALAVQQAAGDSVLTSARGQLGSSLHDDSAPIG